MSNEDAFTSLLEDFRRREAERAAAMPDDKAALNVMMDAYCRLKELGWNDAIYCPKDGTVFEAIEAGSTGIFRCYYDGEWPDGSWWVRDDDDLWPSRPILYRLYPEDEAKRKDKMSDAVAKYAAGSEE